MSTFIRGPVCGVSNCPSRLWRIIDGRRTCQYGHVMEGDVEFNNDDDDLASAGVVTRRLNLTTGATGSFQSSFNASQSHNQQNLTGSKKIHGYQAKVLFIKSFQLVLRAQAKWLIREMNFPPEFEQVVKLIWIHYLQWLDNSNAGHTDVEEHESERQEDRLQLTALQLSMPAALSMLYMASVHMGLPVYTADFIRWIAAAELPYYKANSLLPESWKQQLPSTYLRLLDGGKPPADGHILLKVSQICFRTAFTKNFNCKLRYEGLVLRLVLLGTLPPEFYLYTVELIRLVDEADGFRLIEHPRMFFTKYYQWPELRVIAYFLLTVRWVLLCSEETYPLPWILSLSDRSQTAGASADQDAILARISSSKDESNVTSWSHDETSTYLQWFKQSFLPLQAEQANMSIDHRIAQRKLHKIFPIEPGLSRNDGSASHSSFIDQLQERYLYFLSDVESRWNDQTMPDAHQRTASIAKLEQSLMAEIENQFALAREQITSAVRYIATRCSQLSAQRSSRGAGDRD
ncbi:hypothetical protein HG536_0E04550 [Torulaspora globosa]|uniref:Uncharacterized protein n=1 Tax=Torulaspora globosa TaxID=48254 RepID=A0A7G3ZJ58_9SACH|nr:uncharacterized protein HG536_0E04550 [Torulaspora globosa]QLL33544.1 hypothetical protein HG536_0E04550 [Torulaspora globosa]